MPRAKYWGEGKVEVLIGLSGEEEIMAIFEGKQKERQRIPKTIGHIHDVGKKRT